MFTCYFLLFYVFVSMFILHGNFIGYFCHVIIFIYHVKIIVKISFSIVKFMRAVRYKFLKRNIKILKLLCFGLFSAQ